MNLKSILVSIVSVLSVQVASAEMLNQKNLSPYGAYVKANEEGKEEMTRAFEELAKESSWSKEQAVALESLATNSPAISGDEVLEALDQNLINWFYGIDSQEQNLVHKAARITRTPDEAACAKASLCVVVDIQKQRLFAHLNGRPVEGVNNALISSARKGKVTPIGIYTVEEIAGVNRRSGLYNGAYMGYAMQFMGNYFIHATSKDNYAKLGGPASAGCVRVTLAVAEKLNGLMRQTGRENIRVVVK